MVPGSIPGGNMILFLFFSSGESIFSIALSKIKNKKLLLVQNFLHNADTLKTRLPVWPVSF